MSQQIDRLVVSRGPAMITYREAVFFTREDLVVDLSKDTKEIPSSYFGPLTDLNLGVKASATFRPIGEFEHIDVLWPYASTPVGRSIFGNADFPLLIQPLDDTQRQVTFHAAGISKMPDLDFTATDTLIGDVGFQMVGKNNVATDNANRLFTWADNAIDLDALPYDPDALIIQPYTNSWISAGQYSLVIDGEPVGGFNYNDDAAAVETVLNALTGVTADGGVSFTGNVTTGWTLTYFSAGAHGAITGTVTGMPGGSAVQVDVIQEGSVDASHQVLIRILPWSAFQTRGGMKVAFSLQLTEDESDAIGHYDTIFSGLSVTVTGEPQGVDIEDVLAAAAVQGSGSVRGRRLSTGAHDLNIIGDGVYFRLYAANVSKSGAVFGATKQRVSELAWKGSRSIGGGGTLNPLFYIGTAAPE